MKERNIKLENLLENQLGNLVSESSKEEIFQNKILRPILKFQNELILAIFIEYSIKQKSVFFQLSTIKKLDYIEHSVHKDSKLREFYKGIIVGLFTQDAFNEYITNSGNLNKRINSLLIERLKSQIQLLVVE